MLVRSGGRSTLISDEAEDGDVGREGRVGATTTTKTVSGFVESAERDKGENVCVVYGCLSNILIGRVPEVRSEVGRGKQVKRLISGFERGFEGEGGG